MKLQSEPFNPQFALRNAHLQTIYSSLFRSLPKIDFLIERFTLSDGDFLEAYWLETNKQTKQTPIVILFHGLAGSYESPYIQGAMLELSKAGFNPVLMHFRGSSGVQNLLPRSYHSGDTQDAKEYIASLEKKFPKTKLFCIAYSLGANMLLKLLGEMQENSPIEKAVAVSAPMLLDVCATRMNQGFSKYYQHRLLKELKGALVNKYESHDMKALIGLKREEVKKLKTFWAFDEAYTAPIHGFKSAQDYYAKSSAKQYLKYIKTPTLIIHSKDDPFMTPEVIPTKEELSAFTTLELTQRGGHVGFVSGSLFKPKYWLEEKIVSYFLDETL